MIIDNLPLQPTAFVGRAEELFEINNLLDNPACRLLTLVGPGGIGKTRLALEAATRIVNREEVSFPNGVFFAPLQPITSTDFLLSALADAVGFKFYSGGEPLQQLIDYLCPTDMLLIFDNFEHLLAGVSVVSEILSGTQKLKILVTSRETLSLREEWLYQVKGMRYPDTDTEGNLERYSAVQLFVQSALQVRPDFSLNAEKGAVFRLCQLVEGLPLALEITAAWLKRLPAQAVVQEIERGLDILESTARNAPPRHRSIRAVFEYSWDLLIDTEQDVFKKLSVFRGGFSREAAEIVAGASLGILSALIDKSLLRVDVTGRYELHELLRQYGEERLQESADGWDATCNQHCHYYAQFLEYCWPRLTGSEYKEAFADIETELDNVRSSWTWAFSHRREVDLEVSLMSLWHFYDNGDRYQEGEQMFARAAAALNIAEPLYTKLRAKMLVWQGAICYGLRLFDKGRLLLEESLTILRPTDEPDSVANGLLRLGIILVDQSRDYNTARPMFHQSLALFRELNNTWGTAHALYRLGASYSGEADFNVAESSLQTASDYEQEALVLFQRVGNLPGTALVGMGIANIAYRRGDYARSWQVASESLQLFQDSGIRWGTAFCLWLMGMADCALGKYAEAKDCALQALPLIIQFHLNLYREQVVFLVAEICLGCGETERAYELLSLIDKQQFKIGLKRELTIRLLHQRLAKLDEELPANLVAAVERGKTRDINTTLQELILELSQDIKNSPQTFEEVLPQALLDTLSEREREVAAMIALGNSNSEIAGELVLSKRTVEKHIANIFSKLDFTNRAQIVRWAIENGLANIGA